MRLLPRFAVSFALLLAGTALAADDPVKDTPDKDNTASSRPRVRLGGISIGAGYSHFSGPGFGYYPYYGYGPYGYLYDPFLYGMYLHPGYVSGFGYGPGMGEVKLKSDDKSAWVFLDGALAGKADRLKTIYLEPGAYNLEVRSGDKRFGQKIYVLSGKTLRLTAGLARSEVRP
jgi:hypothetical protein